MWEPVAIPFQNSQAVPTLPTVDEIRACSNVLAEDLALKVVGVNDKVVVKYGYGAHDWEGQALVYLERHAPEVPAPRLYAMYYDAEQLFLVMQRIPGVQMDAIWPSLTPSEKDDVIVKLRHIFTVIRNVECPWPNFFGGLDGGPVRHPIFDDQKSETCRYLGPFSSESAFVDSLVGNYRALVNRTDRPEFKALYYERHLPRVLHGHRPILTHGDAQQKNIMVVEKTGRPNPRGRSFDIVLVDWESSGWLPEYWEFFYAWWPLNERWLNDWFSRLEEVLPVFPAEVAMMEQIDNDLTCPYSYP